jgi:hypothetical protein
MAQQVDVRIAAAVSGTGEIVNMNEVLKNSMTLIEQMEMKYKKAIFQSASINKINEYSRVQLGGLAVAQEKSAINMEHWNAVNKEAFLIKEKLNITDEQAVVMAEKNLAAKAAEAAQQEALNKKLEEEAMQRARLRMETMQMSIGLFVLGITATQTMGALSRMTEGIPVLSEMFKEMQGAISLILGPLQVLLALQQLHIMQNKAMMLSAAPYIAALGTMYLIFRALKAESPALRFALGAIASAMGVLAVATYAAAKANFVKSVSNVVEWVTRLGPAGIAWGPVALVAMGAAILGGTALAMTAPKGQTISGYDRPITQTGLFYGHRGEVVGRVGSMSPSTSNSNSVSITINVASGAVVDDGMVRKLSREIERVVASGNGV